MNQRGGYYENNNYVIENYPGYNVDPEVRTVIDRCKEMGVSILRDKIDPLNPLNPYKRFNTLRGRECLKKPRNMLVITDEEDPGTYTIANVRIAPTASRTEQIRGLRFLNTGRKH